MISDYQARRSAETAAVFVLAPPLAFVLFLSSLRRTLGRTAEGGQLGPIVTAGGVIYVGGLLLMSALTVAVVDAAHHGMTAAAQTINVLSSDAWMPVVASLSIVALGTGITGLRSGGLPVGWLGRRSR